MIILYVQELTYLVWMVYGLTFMFVINLKYLGHAHPFWLKQDPVWVCLEKLVVPQLPLTRPRPRSTKYFTVLWPTVAVLKGTRKLHTPFVRRNIIPVQNIHCLILQYNIMYMYIYILYST